MSEGDKKEYFRKYYQTNKTKMKLANLERHRKDPRIKMRLGAKSRALKSGVKFSLDKDDILIPKRCPVLGIRLYVSDSRSTYDNSPTIDRLIPELGYVPGNIEVISHLANTIKSKGTADQHRAIADWMDKKMKERA